MNYKFQFGQQVKCRITGFQGIVTGHSHYMNGKICYLVEAAWDMKPQDVWIDECRLDLIGKNNAGFQCST